MRYINTRLDIDHIRDENIFEQLVSLWHQTQGFRDDSILRFIDEKCKIGFNCYVISNINEISPLDIKWTPLIQMTSAPQHIGGEELSFYPDRKYAENVMIYNTMTMMTENKPIFRHIKSSSYGTFMIYDVIHLPYFNDSESKWISVGRSILIFDEPNVSPLLVLSEGERRCLDDLAKGFSAKQIALSQNLSSRTVEHRIERIKAKYGARNISHAVAKDIFHAFNRGVAPERTSTIINGREFSARESQCLGLVASGQSANEISATLGISAKSVEKYLANVRTKLGAHNVAELTAKGICLAAEL